MNLNICRLNFEIRLISSQVISKKPFPVQTGSRFSATTIFCHYFYRTWVDTVWISKIRPIVIIWAKNLFLNYIFDLPGNTGSRFLKPKVVCPIPGRTQAFAVLNIENPCTARKPLTETQFMSYTIWTIDCLNEISVSSLFFVSLSLFLLYIF